MDWRLIALHALKTALYEAARQLASAAERRHESGALDS
jgi:hypothetical protein